MTMTYMLYLDGGDGCDYTLACNKALIELKASTREEAEIEAEGHLGDPSAERQGFGCGEGYAEAATILEVSWTSIVDIEAWKKSALKIIHLEKTRQKEEIERLEYERLKAKFED